MQVLWEFYSLNLNNLFSSWKSKLLRRDKNRNSGGVACFFKGYISCIRKNILMKSKTYSLKFNYQKPGPLWWEFFADALSKIIFPKF